MPVDISKLIAANTERWRSMVVVPSALKPSSLIASRLREAKSRYTAVSMVTHVPWAIIAVIHEREASQSFGASIAQGDRWDRVSVHVPAGRGPFKSWEAAAVDALTSCPPFAARWTDWSSGGSLTLLERYNGLGYAIRNLPSPYIWASTNQYQRGKFVSDGHFDPNAVDQQLGCAALLSQLMVLDPSANFAEPR